MTPFSGENSSFMLRVILLVPICKGWYVIVSASLYHSNAILPRMNAVL